jgi:predicted metalloprotease
MRWMGGRESDEVEDRRGIGPVHVAGGGIGIVVIAIVVGLLTGHNPLQILQLLTSSTPGGAPSAQTAPATPGGAPAAEDAETKFVRVILADTEDTWTAIFREHGREYRLPKLVLFDGEVASSCGMTSSAVGPFYCPEDAKVYLDLSFFRELSDRFGAPGDFARAYVVAHEVGHHVQDLLGLMPPGHGHEASIAVELQADCFAGVWGNRGARRGLLEPGDAEEGLHAAAAIGDDRLQRMSTGQVQPETWTHGSSAQRDHWFTVGYEQGTLQACNTFAGSI